MRINLSKSAGLILVILILLASGLIYIKFLNESAYIPLRLVNKIEPIYPRKMLQRGKEGTVTLQGIVDVNGKIKNIEVISSPSISFTRASKKALRSSTFEPSTLNGEKIEETFQTSYKFVLE